MSDANREIIRGAYQAFARGDIGYVMGMLDPGVEWLEAENFIYADHNPYIGPQAVLDGVFKRLGAEWDGFTVTLEQLVAEGDTVIGRGRYRGTCRATGRRADAQFAHVFQFRDGKVVRFQQYTDTAQFRDVVG
jgi:ketosteroid isomerase-like protein